MTVHALTPGMGTLPIGPALELRFQGGGDGMSLVAKGGQLGTSSDGRGPGRTDRVTGLREPDPGPHAIARFWPKVFAAPSGCWEWTAHRSGNGYGQFWNGERLVAAHRFSYELLIGPIPYGLTLDHLCRNRGCVNPWHVEPITGRDNTLRGISFSAINAAKTHCINGHPFFGDNLRVTANGYRRCRTCDYETSRRHYPNRAEQRRIYVRANWEHIREIQRRYRQRKRTAAIAREATGETVYAALPVVNLESACSHLSGLPASDGNSKEEAPA